MKIFAAIEQVAQLLNKLTGNYQSRVKDSLIGTGDGLILTLTNKEISKERREKLIDHYCRQWEANRKKLK